MVMGKTGMVRVLCLLRFHPKGNLCGVKNKVQINRPFHSYVQVLVKTSKIIYFNTVEKNAYKNNGKTYKQGSQICQIWRILRQNCSDDSTVVTEGVTSTPEIFGNKHSFVLTFFATNTIYINCKRCKP